MGGRKKKRQQTEQTAKGIQNKSKGNEKEQLKTSNLQILTIYK
jgi:hypothetical protein